MLLAPGIVRLRRTLTSSSPILPERRVDSLLENAFNGTVISNRVKFDPILLSIIFALPTVLHLEKKFQVRSPE